MFFIRVFEKCFLTFFSENWLGEGSAKKVKSGWAKKVKTGRLSVDVPRFSYFP